MEEYMTAGRGVANFANWLAWSLPSKLQWLGVQMTSAQRLSKLERRWLQKIMEATWAEWKVVLVIIEAAD